MGEEILSGRGDQFGRAINPPAGVQINLDEFSLTDVHVFMLSRFDGRDKRYN